MNSELFDEDDLIDVDELSEEELDQKFKILREKLLVISALIVFSEKEKKTASGDFHEDFSKYVKGVVRVHNKQPLSENDLGTFGGLYEKWKDRFADYGYKQADFSDIESGIVEDKLKELI